MPHNSYSKPKGGKVARRIWGLPKILSQPKFYVRRTKTAKVLLEMDNSLYHFTFPAKQDYKKAKNRKKPSGTEVS